MSKALLVVNRRFFRSGEEYYSEGPSGPETGERYLRWFDELLVAGREGDVGPNLDVSKLNRVGAPGMKIVFLPGISGVREMLVNRAKARGQLRDLMKSVDCVIARNDGLGLLGAQVAMEQGLPLAFDVGGCVYDGFRNHGSIIGRLYAPFAYLRTRRLVKRSGWVSYVTRDFLQRRYPPNSRAICTSCPNVDIPVPEEEVLRGRLEGIRRGSSVLRFGSIASLHVRAKGIDDAIVALARVRSSLPPFEYRVLGGGGPSGLRRLAAKQGIADHVHFDGTVPSGEPVYEWLDRIDVYLHPSKREGLPRAVVEAMSRACPVIASDVAGTPELLDEQFLHRPGDVRRLSRLVCGAADVDWRRAAAQQNWGRARAYSRPVLLARRDAFWGQFAAATGRVSKENGETASPTSRPVEVDLG